MILVDTSVWIGHLRSSSAELANRLYRNEVLIHSMVIGELACGSLRNRDRLLQHLQDLPRIASVTDDQAIQFIDAFQIMNRGLGFVDVHLLAAVAGQPGTRLWTSDPPLHEQAANLRLAFE